MPTASAKPTTAANLEAKFDAGEDVLDFFDVDSTKVVVPNKATTVAFQTRVDRPAQASHQNYRKD